MATQYTSILKLALPVTGELSGTWGDVVNNNITSMVEQAIAGLSTINTWTANAHTLTVADGTTSESRCAMLVADTGAGGTALTAAGEIICPAASKLYVLKNGAAYAVTLKTAAGTGVAVPAGDTAFLFCDGTNVNACVTTIVNGHISGNLTVDGNTTLGDANTDTVTVTAQFASDLLPSTDNARDLGSTAKSWRTLYCDTSVLTPLVTATNLQVTNIKANDGTAAMSIADSTGAITVSTLLNVDNLRLDGNTLSSTDSNGNVVLAPNGTGDVQLDADTVRIGDSNANATITTNGTGDLILNTNSGTNSGSITIQDGVDGNIIIAPNGNGQVQITNAALDLTTIEVSNINAKDGTAAITIADSTGAVGISTAVTMSATTQNIALGTSQTTGTFTVGGAAQTGTQTFDQSTKTHTLNVGSGATESGLTKTVNIGTGGVATSTTAINIGSTNGTTITLNGTVNATTVNVTTLDLTNLEVTNIKAKDGTAALSIADSTGAVTVSSAFAANGGVTIGDASGDAFTINSSAVSTPNGLNFDSNTFVIDATNNRVGINNASPTVALDVTGGLTISGNAILGDASTDTVLVNGYIGQGVSPSGEYGYRMSYTGSTAVAQYGFFIDAFGSSAATTSVTGLRVRARSSAAAYTMGTAWGLFVDGAGLGAGSTITNATGVYIQDQTVGTNNFGITSAVSSGTNKWNIYASGTANNAFAGNVRIGSVTAPTNALDVTGAMTVSGNTTLGDASTDTVQVNGYMGVGGAPGASTAITVAPTALTGTLQYGVSSQPTGTSAATNSIIAFDAFAQVANAVFTVNNVYGLSVRAGSKGASATATNWHGIQIADQTQGTNNYGITSLVSSGANKWNIYASGTAANYFAGKALVGTTTDQDGRLIIRSTGNTYANSAVAIVDSANTTKLQMLQTTSGFFYMTVNGTDDFVLKPTESVFNESGADIDFRVESDTNTHALFVDAGNSRVGIGTNSPVSVLDVAGTTPVLTIKDTQNKSWVPNDTVGDLDFYSSDTSGTGPRTVARVRSLADNNATTVAGALSFWTSAADSAATEKVRITSAGNVSIGGTANRATTVGTAALNIFNGTAPVGTLTNGISIYSAAGEAYVMDAAGNATLFSPHDKETNEWIFKSKHTPTGKVLKIDVEKLLRFVNNHFGLDAIQEFIEE